MTTTHFLIQSAIFTVMAVPGFATAQHATTYVEQHHSPTAEESELRGIGYLLRNSGAGFRDWSEGHRALAQAQHRYLENRQLALRYRFDNKQMNAAYRAMLRPTPPTAEQLGRWAKANAPQPLTAADLTAAGDVRWPLALCEAPLARFRMAIELDLHHLAMETNPASMMQRRRSLIKHCTDLKEQLQSRIREFPTADYIQASKFLDSLQNPRGNTTIRQLADRTTNLIEN